MRYHKVMVVGVSGGVSPERDLSSNMPHHMQRSIHYFQRRIETCAEPGESYLFFSPDSVKRLQPCGDKKLQRATEVIQILADDFQRAAVRAAIESGRVSWLPEIVYARGAGGC